jgi:hypothetical protein
MVGTAELLAQQQERENEAERVARIEAGLCDRQWFDAATDQTSRAGDTVQLDDGVYWSPAKADLTGVTHRHVFSKSMDAIYNRMLAQYPT